MNICKVAIYDESNVPQICAEKLATFLRTTFGIKVEIYSQLSYTLDDILQCTIKNMLRPIEHQIDQGTHTDSVLMYDGISLQQAFTKMIPQEHQRSDWLHVIFTAKLVGTYDYDGCKYHSRALIDYISQATKVPYDGWNDWIEYKDTRLEYAAKAYLMQALVYYATGSSFCKDPKCILYNAHWQQELVKSQIESGSLCAKHHAIAQNMLKDTR